MSKGVGPVSRRVRTGRLALCSVAAFTTLAANWVNPPPLAPAPAKAPVQRPAPRLRPAEMQPDQASGGLAPSALAVTHWSFRSGDGEDVSATGRAPAGQSLTLSMTLDGDQAALAEMRTRGSIAIEVHWQRQSGSAAPGAPDLVTRLAIGHPGLADRLAGEVRRTGFFEWHSWAEKTTLSPGVWSVSLTCPDGTPLACGSPPAPCRFRIAVG